MGVTMRMNGRAFAHPLAGSEGLAARLRDHVKRLTNLALGAIVIGAAFDVVLLAIEIEAGWDDRPIHVLTAVMTLSMIVIAGISYSLLRMRVNDMASDADLALELQSYKAAEETAARNRSRYFANLSHEMRSPLNTIYGYSQLIEQNADLSPQKAAGVIRRCAEHMTSLVESLVDLSQIENGVLRLRLETVCLPEFIEQIVSMMRPAARAKGLDFSYEESGRIPRFVRTDPQRLRQALINLLSNAIKFTPEGSVTFRVSYRGQVAVFEIVDTGPGIAPGDQGEIFEPYVRLEQCDRVLSAASGLGLGLTITRSIVSILGGNLELESTIGKGSSFRLTIMLGEVANTQLPAVQRRIEDYEGRRRSILVVDDDPDQHSFLAQFLATYGFEVRTALDGETAVEEFVRNPADLAIVDISLPGISGWETVERLREVADGDFFAIMASANAGEFHRPEHDRPAHDLFFVKPYRLDQIAEGIGGLLGLTWRLESIEGLGSANESGSGDRVADSRDVGIARLREAVRIGHVRGIESGIQALEGSLPPDDPLVASLYLALDQFNLAGMARMLEEQ